MADVNNVSYGKPLTDGAILAAPLGTTLPTDATGKLDAKFVSLGYVSEDGISNENTPESEKIKAWGGKTVLVSQTEKADTYKFTLIGVLNVDVLKVVYGDENVSGTLKTGITIKANAKPMKARCFVIETILSGDTIKRMVIPNGVISEVGEISYKDDEAIGYETTIECLPDSDGNTHYEYIKGAEPSGVGA
ncbi:MAG: phage tail protein [Tissierellia bacterium]|nr:phage tail protein [Tissierellia bacterium]